MSRTYDADPILAALIEEYQREDHFVFSNEGKIFARLIATEDADGPLPFHGKVDVCLTSLAAKIAERLSQ
ncbi:hypothetical protein RMR10_010130 [Agrobacterium rosae]|uniref:Uncharacterized protein n=1 Tax=Agrobacterium rosae TaxID=1972867 RepID=A0AAW9FEA2_9HYPH|nr:hypothetical protein [Agrobacterium rosae]MDX8301466.1 hypothetical protein [Agrobacterium rosae]MDX8312979.1 hypothetical protein [Agrobacterium rosae]